MNTTVAGHNAVGGATKRGAPDPTLVLPEGVKAAGSRADALIEQARQAKVANEAAGGNELVKPLIPAPKAPNPTILTGDFDPNNPNPPQFDPNTQPQQPPRFQQSTPSAPNPPPAPQQPTPQNEGDWEHQFKSLKGRYDREQEDKRRLQQTLQDQQRLLANMAPRRVICNRARGVGCDLTSHPLPPVEGLLPQKLRSMVRSLWT